MTKTEQIENAIEKALKRESKLTPLALSVPMLGSLNIRHLLNNLGSISTSFCEVGSHVGGSFVSAVFGNTNLIQAVAIDSWASDKTEGHAFEKQFYENVEPLISNIPIKVIKSDSFEVNLENMRPIDFYYFDGSHDYESQRKALIYYLPVLSDKFIFAVDDYMLPEVRRGTQDAIIESECKIIFEQEFETDIEYNNESFWRSWYVCFLKKGTCQK